MSKDKPTGQPNLPDKTPKLTDKAEQFKKGKTDRKGLSDQTANILKEPEAKFDYKAYFTKQLDQKSLEQLKEIRGKISANDVLKLQETNHNIIAQLYCEPADTSKEWTFKTYGNKSVERNLGLVDVYRYDFSVTQATITSRKGKVKNTKREGIGGNFYADHGYAYIFEGYKVSPTKILSKDETDKLQAEFSHKTAHQIEKLKDEVPTELQKRFGDQLLPRLVKESVRQGVDSKYILSLLEQENDPDGKEFGKRVTHMGPGFLNQLRWAVTRVKNNEMLYAATGKKAKDSNQNYTSEFISFDSRQNVAGNYIEIKLDPNKPVVEQIKSKLNSEQRGNADIIQEEFQKAGLSPRIIAAAIVNARMESNLNAKAAGDNGDSIGLFQLNKNGAGKGLSVAEREDPRINTQTILKLVLGPTGEALRKRDAEGASISELTAIFCRDIEKPSNVKYRMDERTAVALKMFGEKENSSAIFREAMERLENSPQNHTAMEIAKNAKLTSDYMWRGASKDKNPDGTSRYAGSWHKGVDISMGEQNYQLTAPESGQVAYMGSNPSGAGYYIDYKCPDKNGDMIYFRFMHCDPQSFAQLQASGKRIFHKGEALLKTGASGNATTAEGKQLWHLHMEVRRQKEGHGDKILTDPFPYLPKEMQAQLLVYREKHKERYNKTMALLASGSYKNREGFRENETLSA